MDYVELRKSLRKFEGFSGIPYLDTKGNWTIGIGRNLTGNPLTEEEAWSLNSKLINSSIEEAQLLVHNWRSLNSPRQNVLIELVFNMGLAKVLKFQRMRAAIDKGDYAEAGRELLNSKWTEDVGPRRSSALVTQMETGEWPS